MPERFLSRPFTSTLMKRLQCFTINILFWIFRKRLKSLMLFFLHFLGSSHWSNWHKVTVFVSGTSSRWMTSSSTTATLKVTSSVFTMMKMFSWWFERADTSRATSKDPSISFRGSCSSPGLRTCRCTTPQPEHTKINVLQLRFTGFYWHTESVLKMRVHSNTHLYFAGAEVEGKSRNTLLMCLRWFSRCSVLRLMAGVYWCMRPSGWMIHEDTFELNWPS